MGCMGDVGETENERINKANAVVEKTAEVNNAAADATTKRNRPNIYTPNGSLTWGTDANGRDSYTVNLSPEQQAAKDAQAKIQAGRSEFAQSMLGSAENAFKTPFTFDTEAARKQAVDANYGQATSRLDPQWNQREQAMKAQLANQGFSVGDEGYTHAMDDFSRSRNDAYTSAMNSAIGSGAQTAQQLFALAQAQREMPLNELNAMLSGQQVALPTAPGFNQAAAYRGADYTGAANTAYQQGLDDFSKSQAQQQSMMNAFGGLAGMAGGLFSLL